MKTVFISYHFNDKSYKGEIKKWLEEKGARVISVDESDLRPLGSEQVKKQIRNDLSRSSHLLVLVGNDTHNRPWVDYEVSVARSRGIPTYCVRLANRTVAAPKEVRGLSSISYSRSSIQAII